MSLWVARIRHPRPILGYRKEICIRSLHVDGRTRLSNEWVPSGGIAASKNEDAHSKLIRAGFLRQSHSGIFQLLPLGLRVQEKITRLVDRYMRSLGASRTQLSAISHESLWEQSGRLNKIGSELFRFTDRKEGRYLLGPTHEEEITTLVAQSVKSYKNLPLRVYQITQKYRDELRPRHGLLRGRDFCMKDLYTFDYSTESALKTYEEVREAYSQIFLKEMKLPVLVAKASSGDMGGNLSHEYHIPTALGEDHVMSCNKCDYVANEEVAESRASGTVNENGPFNVWRGISKDRKVIVNVWYGSEVKAKDAINAHAVKQVFPDLDSGVETPHSFWSKAGKHDTFEVINLFDSRLPEQARSHILSGGEQVIPENLAASGCTVQVNGNSHDETNFLRIQDGDACPRCDTGTLSIQKAIELGHTFHLGTRYSEPMEAYVTGPKHLLESSSSDTPPSNESIQVPMQMGCYGIGISRIIGAVANHLVDSRGLNWPRVIAPYEVVVIPNPTAITDAEAVYDATLAKGLDVILDDRNDVPLGWKLKDADLVGYPVLVVLGKEWKASGRAEVQCRRLGVKELVAGPDLAERVEDLLKTL